MRKSLWSPDEDDKLRQYVAIHGCGNWSNVAKHAGLRRCGKSCRLRWINYLRPDLRKGPFTTHEVRLVVNLHKSLGNRWSKIASYLPGRTDNDVKNFWHSYTRAQRLRHHHQQQLQRKAEKVNAKESCGYDDYVHLCQKYHSATPTSMTKPEKVDDAIIEDHKQIGSDACHNSSTQIDANPCKVPDMQTPQFPSIFYFHSRDQASSMAYCHNRKPDNNVLHCAYTLCHDELEPSLHSDLERKVDIDMAIFNAAKGSSPMQNEFDEEFGLAEIYKGTHGYPVSSKTSRIKESARHHGTCSNAMAKYTGNFCITRPTQTHTDEDVWRLSSANGFTKVAPMLCLQDGPAESVDEQMQYGYSDQDIEMEGLQSMIERFFNHKDLQPASTTITSAPSQQAHHRSSHHNHRNQEAGDVISYQATKTEESSKILERSTRPLGTCEVAHEIESLSGSFNLQYLQAQYIANCLS